MRWNKFWNEHKSIRRKVIGKVFEDYFTELQTDMISICLEYAEDRAEKIFP